MKPRAAASCSLAWWLAGLTGLAGISGEGPGALADSPPAVAGARRGKEAPAPSLSVGLFLGDAGARAAEADEIRRGAEDALIECEEDPGEAPVLLHVASRAGSWSAGAGELVRLIYGRQAGAVLGPADNRSAHVAGQVTARAKGRAVVLTPWASDPSLTRTGVPWFFRLVHDDRQQADALIEEIVDERGLRRILLVVGGPEPDSARAAEVFEQVAGGRCGIHLRQAVLAAGGETESPLAAESREFGAEAVVFLLPPAAAARAARSLRDSGAAAPFFGPLELSSPAFLEAAGGAAEGMVLAAPGWLSGPRADRFRARYRGAHGRDPGIPAAYGHDGARLLAAALREVSRQGLPERPGEASRRYLETIRWEGLTGTIEFDAKGNRVGPAPLARVENLKLVPITRAGRVSPR